MVIHKDLLIELSMKEFIMVKTLQVNLLRLEKVYMINAELVSIH